MGLIRWWYVLRCVTVILHTCVLHTSEISIPYWSTSIYKYEPGSVFSKSKSNLRAHRFVIHAGKKTISRIKYDAECVVFLASEPDPESRASCIIIVRKIQETGYRALTKNIKQWWIFSHIMYYSNCSLLPQSVVHNHGFQPNDFTHHLTPTKTN